MKKLISVLLAIAVVFGTGAFAFAENKTSVPEGYIGIYTAEDLNNIRNNLSGKYILMNDIDLSVYENWEPIGTTEAPFTGELDGNGYYISSLKISGEYNREEDSLFGLFGYSRNAVFNGIAVVKADIDVTGKEDSKCYIGLICAYQYNCSTTNCLTDGKIKSNGFSLLNIGGTAGAAQSNSKIKNCSNYADFEVEVELNTNSVYLGGICGSYSPVGGPACVCNYGNIVFNEMSNNENAQINIGGIFGRVATVMMPLSNYYNRGNIEINSSSKTVCVGGIAGTCPVTVNSCNIGNISVCENFSGYVANITGNFTTSALVPVPGALDYDRIENAYYIYNGLESGYCEGETYSETSENTRDYRFVNVNSIHDEEMKNQATFTGLDFESVWEMEENGYPVLKNQPTVAVKENIELVEGDVYSNKIITSEWKTSNPDVATVNENGEIVAVSVGGATITVDRAYGYTEEFSVNVINPNIDNNSFLSKIVSLILNLLKKVGSFVISVFRNIK